MDRQVSYSKKKEKVNANKYETYCVNANSASFSAICVRVNASPQPDNEIAIEMSPRCSAQIAAPKWAE
jgi:hypothetical protein